MAAGPKLVTLEEWARLTYGDSAPSLATLRRWARDAKIVPAPQKHGRSYFVSPNATYEDYRSPGTLRLIDRIKADHRR